MNIHQQWKEELVALVNASNGLSLKTTDVNFSITNRDDNTNAVTVTVTPGDVSPYFNEQALVYVPRDIAKNFTGIPLRLIVQNDTTIRAMLARIADRFGISLDDAVDFTQADLDKAISFASSGIQNIEVDVADTSFVWVGKLQFTVANDTLSLETIIANVELTTLQYLSRTDGKGSLAMVSLADINENASDVIAVNENGEVEKAVFSTMLDTCVARGVFAAEDAAAILASEAQATVPFTLLSADDVTAMSSVASYQTPSFEGKLFAMGEVVKAVVTDPSILTMTMGAGNVEIFLGRAGVGYTVDWGDGSAPTTVVPPASPKVAHNYDANGPYTCTVVPTNPTAAEWDNKYNGVSSVNGTAVTAVVKWADFDTGQTKRAINFMCPNLVEIPDYWPGWKNAQDMFAGCAKLVASKIGGWDVSMVTNFTRMFKGCKVFNTNINGWKVDNAKEFIGFLFSASAYNQPLNAWVMSKVVSLDQMFDGCYVFNQDLSSWDVGNVTSMVRTFANAEKFNQNLSGWNVAKVTNHSNFDNWTPAWEASKKPVFA